MNKKLTPIFAFVFTLLLISCDSDTVSGQEQQVVPEFDEALIIGEPTGKKVSSLLTGINAVYNHEDMNSWLDGNKINHLKNTGISALRYPGGHVVSYWDWEFPYHNAYQDFWNTNYQSSLDDTKQNELKETYKNRMLIDDYFNICNDADIEPVVGINMFQGWKYNRNEESIDKAVRLVKQCLEKDPSVIYFYLDNEAGHQPTKNNHVPIDDYIALIPAYSQAIKAVHPEAKLIPNIMRWNLVEKMIKETGQYWDVYDQHWYYGSSGKWAYFNLDEWRNEKESETQAKRLADFNRWKNQYGMNHLKFSYLEWNGPPPDLAADSNPATLSNAMLGLIQADQLMFFAKNEVHMAIAWPMTWQTENNDVNPNEYNRNLLDKDDTSFISPSATIFKAYSFVQDGDILENNNNESTGLRVLSVKRAQNNGYAILVLNKSKTDQTLEIEFPEEINNFIEAIHFKEGNGPYNVEVKASSPELRAGKLYPTIESTSFAYILLNN